MACPYFIPAEVHPRELWPHRERLPLGDGFAGRCGAQTPDARCDDETLRMHCNLGYANLGAAKPGAAEDGGGCVHLPRCVAFDAVRFVVRSESPAVLRVQFAGEHAHRPALCGELRYDRCLRLWLDPPDAWLLHLAEAAVRAWIARNARAARD